MGRIASILSFSRIEQSGVKTSNVKINTGGGVNITAQHYSAPGDDSYPLETDFAAISSIPRRGGAIAIGYLDPLNTPKAQKGDKRIYARDSSGVVVAEVWLKNDNTILATNGSGSFELRPSGTIDLNGVTIDPSGNIITPTTIEAAQVSAPSVMADGKEIAEHDHSQGNDSAGNSQVDTGPNN